MAPTHAAQKRYPPELRERAVRMVRETIAEHGGERYGVVSRIAKQLGMTTESLRNWTRTTGAPKVLVMERGSRPISSQYWSSSWCLRLRSSIGRGNQ